jgi:CBS domain-containing protein
MPRDIDLRKILGLKVKDVMNRRPQLCRPDTRVSALLKKFLQLPEDYVFVVDEKKHLQGIVTESDVLYALKRPSGHMFIGGWSSKELTKITAGTIDRFMTRHPMTVEPETDLREALDLMITHKFRHLPVVEKNRVVGAITIHDIIRVLLK